MRVAQTLLALLWLPVAALSAADFEIKQEAEFKRIVSPSAKVEKLASGFKFVEGPQWVPSAGGFLIFSDIPSDTIHKWTAKEGVTVFRQPSSNANGNTIDNQGRVLSAEHAGRRLALREKDGAVVTLVDTFNGKKFNSPNDVVVKRDGTVWFTDPPYGLVDKNDKQQAGNYVFRLDPASKKISIVIQDCDMPNGLCFSPDEKRLYIADSGKPKNIRVYEVNADGTTANGKVFCAIDKGAPDGIRCDSAGRVWSSAEDGVQIFDPNGNLIGKILVPESPANLTFGGEGMNTLFITARKSLYAIPVLAKGIK